MCQNAVLLSSVILYGILSYQSEAAILNDISRDVRSDRLTLNAGLSVAPNVNINTKEVLRLEVPTGGALDLFYRFGFYSLSIRVVPRDDPGTWLIREPTARVFDDNSVFQIERKGADTFDQQPFEIFLCEDLEELYQAFFRNFQAEGINQPHKLFTGSWRVPIAAKYLGLSSESLTSGNSFVLVKLTREKMNLNVAGDLRLKPEPFEAIQKISVENSEGVLEFVQRFGSHYIKDVTVGDAIFQVFVISRDQFDKIQPIVGTRGNTLDVGNWKSIHELYLAPWLVHEAGEIKCTSGDAQLQKFLGEELKIQGQFDSYPNLIESLLRNQELVRKLEDLTSNTLSITGLNLASLSALVVDPQIRLYFDETLKTHSALFEINVK